jgi:hypothetical protein
MKYGWLWYFKPISKDCLGSKISFVIGTFRKEIRMDNQAETTFLSNYCLTFVDDISESFHYNSHQSL